MSENTVTIDLPEGDDLVEQIVEAAARQSLRMLTAPGPEGEQSEVPTALGRKIEEVIAERIQDEAAKAAPKVAERILDEGVVQTTRYGSPLEKKPVRDIVAAEVVKQLTASSGRGSLGREKPVIEAMIEDEVKKQVRGELQGALDEAKAKVAEAVGAEASEALMAALKKGLPGVKV